MAYFNLGFRDTANTTSACNVEIVRSGQNPEGREGGGHTFAIDP